MPALPNGRKDVEIRTNMGNPSIMTKHRSRIKLSSTITAKAVNVEEPLPTIGSKVIIKFLENSPQYCYWSKFNMNFDYDVIPEEKYARQFYLKVGDKEIPVHRDDKIIFDIGDENEVVILNPENKEKTFRILNSINYTNEINNIKNIIGESGGFKEVQNEFGEKIPEEYAGSGILATIENFKARIEELETKLSELENREQKNIENEKYEE